MRRFMCLAGLAAAAVTGTAQADLIITEIFYNLAGSEGSSTEWAEIYNDGATAVDLENYAFADTQDNAVSDLFPAGTSIAAGGTLIVTQQAAATFHSIWGPGINVVSVGNFPSLANSASATNETVALLDPGALVVDDVNYENATNGWPDDTGSASIYLLPGALSAVANDTGSNWANATDGIDGAYTALIPNPDISTTGLDVASPGVVPEPGTLAALGLLSVCGLRRRG